MPQLEGIQALFFSTCILLVFLLLGKLVRVKTPLLQKLFLPSSIIGGFIALAFGPFGFNLIPDWATAAWVKFPGILINVVFATLFLGVTMPKAKQIWSLGGSQLCYGALVGVGQYFVALITLALFIKPFFDVPDIFACIVEIGFSGGHGTAAGMTPVLEELGFAAGGALAQMSATIGLITAVVGGIIMVNIGIRKGYCASIRPDQGLSKNKQTGLIPHNERYSIATATVASEAIEPLALHAGVVGVAILVGWAMLLWIQAMFPSIKGFPLFPLAMIGGMFVQSACNKVGMSQYFDRGTFERLLGISLDVLVLSAVATLKLDLFVQNIGPFAIIMATGIAWPVFATLVLAPRMFPKFWFERGITEFGMQTGVTAIGLLLLRLVDPGYRTGTADAFGFKQMVYEPFLGGGLITAMAPALIIAFGIWPTVLICGAIMIVCVIIAALNGWINLHPNRQATPLE